MLGDTAEAYFSSSLLKISGYLHLSPNIAGVTLLALGNGAPDLSAIIVGTLGGDTDVGLSAPIGGGMFVTSGMCCCLLFVVFDFYDLLI